MRDRLLPRQVPKQNESSAKCLLSSTGRWAEFVLAVFCFASWESSACLHSMHRVVPASGPHLSASHGPWKGTSQSQARQHKILISKTQTEITRRTTQDMYRLNKRLGKASFRLGRVLSPNQYLQPWTVHLAGLRPRSISRFEPRDDHLHHKCALTQSSSPSKVQFDIHINFRSAQHGLQRT